MAKRDILKEAIADAKAVKEVAIANAKAALEESMTPHLKSMLAAKIQEMDEEDDKEVDEMLDPDLDMREPAEDEYAPARDTVDRTMMESEDEDEVDLDEILAELEKETLNEAEE